MFIDIHICGTGKMESRKHGSIWTRQRYCSKPSPIRSFAVSIRSSYLLCFPPFFAYYQYLFIPLLLSLVPLSTPFANRCAVDLFYLFIYLFFKRTFAHGRVKARGLIAADWNCGRKVYCDCSTRMIKIFLFDICSFSLWKIVFITF